MTMVTRIALARRRRVQIGLFALTLCALPGLAEAAEPTEETEGEGEDDDEKVPGERLAKLASEARATCREVAKIDENKEETYSSLLPPKPDTTGMSKKAKAAALAEYEKKRKEVSDPVRENVPLARDLCEDYCAVEATSSGGKAFAGSIIDLCDLESSSLAAVTVLVAPDQAIFAAEDLGKIVEKFEIAKQGGAPADKAGPESAFGLPVAAQSAIAAAFGLGSGSTSDLAAGLAAALAEFVLERAKREALAFVLDRMSKDLCETDKSKPPKPWFPHLCALAGDERLGSYAAGAALLEALQGALLEDARSWPGIMVGTTLAARATESSKEQAAAAAERAFGRISRGNNPALALHGLGIEIAALDSTKLRASGCALALPAGFLNYHELLKGLPAPEPAALLAALVGSYECSDLVPPLQPKAPKFDRLEKLLYVWQQHDKELRLATVTGAALVAAQQEYDAAMAAQPSTKPAAGGEAESTPEAEAKKKEEQDAAAQRDAVVVRRQSATVTLYGSSVEFTRMSVTVLEAFEPERKKKIAKLEKKIAELETKIAGLQSKKSPSEAEIKNVKDELDKYKDELEALEALKEFKADLEAFDTVAKLLDAQLHERWGEAVALLARHLDKSCAKECDSTIERLGTVAAMLTAGDDGEAVEDALRAAAHPPGGWRSKAKRGSFTVSLTAFPGLYTAAELRWGPYGAVVENGDAYVQAPTLAMPIGLDFAWGVGCQGVGEGVGMCKCEKRQGETEEEKKKRCAAKHERTRGRNPTVVGLFVPIIDPAAFLGYDVENDGKLPGARLTTVLSPGVGFRVTPPRTPFAILAYATYRPQYRTWEATLDGPGASVLQFGINLAVDVTLWKITSGGKRRERSK